MLLRIENAICFYFSQNLYNFQNNFNPALSKYYDYRPYNNKYEENIYLILFLGLVFFLFFY
jgi:hypothetical protein